MRRAKGRPLVGISGWKYPPWRGVFYPRGVTQARELQFVARHFPTVEVNGSFYCLLRPTTYQRWYDETPRGFVFAVKGSRFITHMKRLAGVEDALANFFASGILALREKLGPILWQLPASFAFDGPRLERFFRLLPRSLAEARKLGRHHDHRLDGRSYLKVDRDAPIRHALEPRHPSFASAECAALLRSHGIAMCIADNAKKWPTFDTVTADFVYVRLHGDTELYVSGYEPEALASWAARIERWQTMGKRKRDAFVYFDNDARVRAPYDAHALAVLLGAPPTLVAPDLTGAGEAAREVWPAWSAVTPALRKQLRG
jgi:uncharacterized protein YecE (DUF72 family)